MIVEICTANLNFYVLEKIQCVHNFIKLLRLLNTFCINWQGIKYVGEILRYINC